MVEQLEQRLEVERAIARHGEGTVDHGLQKAPIAVARQLDDLWPHILAVDVADAIDVLGEHGERITTPKAHVPAIE